MGRRGNNAFRRNDGLRALKIAKDGGLEPNAMEVIVAPDGAVTYRVYGKGAAGVPETATDAREWQDEIDKLKGKAPKAKGQ